MTFRKVNEAKKTKCIVRNKCFKTAFKKLHKIIHSCVRFMEMRILTVLRRTVNCLLCSMSFGSRTLAIRECNALYTFSLLLIVIGIVDDGTTFCEKVNFVFTSSFNKPAEFMVVIDTLEIYNGSFQITK